MNPTNQLRNDQITVKPTKGFTVPPKGKEYYAEIHTVDGTGSHGTGYYGSTPEIAKARLIAYLEEQDEMDTNALIANERQYHVPMEVSLAALFTLCAAVGWLGGMASISPNVLATAAMFWGGVR